MKKEVEDLSIAAYRRKRNFRKTAEPPPRTAKKRAAKELMFVIQKHAATRLHYDFRLEMEGVLKSWAVPKEIPLNRGDRRLAIHVEDHPMDYARFEGTIPEGQYGGGTVMVWDIGTYKVSGENPARALNEGKLHLTLSGKKLKGEWTLVRMKARPGDSKENWLFFKSGEDAPAISARAQDQSVLSKRSMDQIAHGNSPVWQSDRPAKAKATPARARSRKRPAAPLLTDLTAGKLGFVPPMKSRLVSAPPKQDGWIYELKFDGYRTIAIKQGENVELISRNQKSFTSKYPEIARAFRKFPAQRAVLDGEIVALDAEGRSSFQLLQMAGVPHASRAPLCFYAFDVLHLEGKDLKQQPLQRRKEILESLITEDQEPIRFSAGLSAPPDQLLAQVRKLGLEGIIAKQADSKYEPGQRSGAWLKIKVSNEQEFVIGGYTPPKGSRAFFGAILVGYYADGKLRFASKVGTGFSDELLEDLFQRFQKLKRPDCPFVNLPERSGQGVGPAEMRRCIWLDPRLVAEIRFSEWTRDGHLRQPAFGGLREDVNPAEVVRERAATQ